MRRYFFALTFVTTLMATPVFAQHSDVEFGYDNLLNPTQLIFEVGEEADGTPLVNAAGVPFFEGAFEELDPTGDPGNFSGDNPGFATAFDEGLVANTGDQIFVEFLDASASSLFGGLGFATFYNDATGSLEAAGNFEITGNSDAFPALQFDAAANVSGSTVQFVDTVANNTAPITGELIEFDEHVLFDVLDDSAVGAYAFALRLHSNFAGTSVDEFELTSDPFLIILNNQLDDDLFEDTVVPLFVDAGTTTAVPEPGSLSLSAMGMWCGILRRSQRRLS